MYTRVTPSISHLDCKENERKFNLSLLGASDHFSRDLPLLKLSALPLPRKFPANKRGDVILRNEINRIHNVVVSSTVFMIGLTFCKLYHFGETI